MLRMDIKCIPTKSFIEMRTMHQKSRQVEVYTGSDTTNVIDTLFNTLILRISKLKPYISKYSWEGINFPARLKDWQKFEKNNDTIALNILYIEQFTNNISVVYKSKYNNKHKKQAILSMIGDGVKYNCLAVTNLSGLLKGISSNQKEDFYCLNCFNSYTTKNKFKEHEEICNKHDSCHMEMPKQVILKHNPGEKSLKAPFTIYLDLECILKKVQSCQNNPEKSYTEKIARHEPSGWSMFKKCSFNKKENKLSYYRGKDCIEILCKN